MQRLFKHILVPLDFTQKNVAALRVALDLAQQNQSRVTLIHVIEKIEYADDDNTKTFYAMLRNRAQGKLATSAEDFKAARVPIEEEVIVGKTGGEIVSFAMRNKVDLVVLSSHKVKLDEAPKGWATLSYQVSILCQCPVMLVK